MSAPTESLVKVEPQAVAPMFTDEEIEQIVLSGDYGELDSKQRAYVLVVLCRKMGLDPMRRPFEFIAGDKGVVRLYANRAAAAQLREVNEITQTPVYFGALRSITFKEDGTLELGDVLSAGCAITIFKAVSKDRKSGEPRISYNVSAMAIDTQLEWMVNGVKKMWTQAERRTTIGHVGLGFLDESEASDVGRPSAPVGPQATRIPAPPQARAQVQAAPVAMRVPAPQPNRQKGIAPPTEQPPAAATAIPVEATVVKEEGPQRTAPAQAAPAPQPAAPKAPAPPQAPRIPQGGAPVAAPIGPRPAPKPLPPKPGPVQVMPGVTVGPPREKKP